MNTENQQTPQATQLGLPHTHTSANEQFKPDFSTEEIEGTPFTLVKLPNKSFISYGPIRITPEYETKEKVMEWLNMNLIKAIATMAGIIAEHVYKHNEAQKQQTTLFEEPAKKGPVNTNPRKEALIDLMNQNEDNNKYETPELTHKRKSL